MSRIVPVVAQLAAFLSVSKPSSSASLMHARKLLPTLAALLALLAVRTVAGSKPHIIFVMADDMGWGETGYRGHPVLKTPHLDAMAASGLRFEGPGPKGSGRYLLAAASGKRFSLVQ